MPITNEQQYQEAQSVFAAGTAKDMPRLRAAILEYENRAGISDETPAEAAPPQEVPKAGPQGYWAPQRPLSTTDYIPQDMGGGLAVWRDMPLETYQRKVALPQRQMAIATGEKALMELQRLGPGAFPPEALAQMTMAIAQGKAAAAQDPGAITEDDPGYKQFNEQQWQQAVQQRQQDPNAGPIQRLERIDTSGVTGKLFYGTEKSKDLLQAGARGALDMATLGLGTGAMDAVTEAISGREAVDVSRGAQDAHPIVTGLGGAAMALARPGLAGPALMRGIYGKAAPVLGRYGAAALSGAVSTAAEGLGRDVSAEAADALSDAPSAEQDMGRLDAGRLGANTLARAGMGAAGGLLGQGVSDAARGVANKISEAAIRGTGGRTPYETAEAAGYQFDPVRGIVVPEAIKQQQAATRETGVSWAERFADRARGGVVENVDKFHVAEKAAMGHENLAYFKSVKGQNPTPLTNTMRAASEIVEELRGVNPQLAAQVKRIVYGFDPAMKPQQMEGAIKTLSGEAEAAAAGSNQIKAEAMKRLQAAMMEDIKALPRGNLEGRLAEGPNGETIEGWPALRAEHGARRGYIDEIRQLSGAKEEGAALPNAVAELNKNLMSQGRRGFPAAKEKVLDRFMPPELKREALMLKAANMVEEMGGAPTGAVPYPSRAGVIDWAAGKLVPRAYGLGRALSKPVPEGYPVSDAMFSWVNARMPRATMFVPGMDLTKAVRDLAEMQNRPKKWSDLTPEQQQLLLGALGTTEQQEVLQETP